MGNLLLHNFCCIAQLCMTFSGFQVFKTDLRLMTKSSNSVKPNLLLHNTKVTCIITIVVYKVSEGTQYWGAKEILCRVMKLKNPIVPKGREFRFEF